MNAKTNNTNKIKIKSWKWIKNSVQSLKKNVKQKTREEIHKSRIQLENRMSIINKWVQKVILYINIHTYM